ncbi:MAG TPA: MlaD family protein [Polyangiaceae bacterium]|jgi:phospholipid/cholesterol/gamma-HCH transport system substrate-binding protein|nr:MlaD family protein [Polyangiaceae bacterium]
MVSSRDVKVGAFVLAGLTAIGAVIFLIGDERQMFDKKVPFATEFEDVQGLRRGSPVRMGGVDVGSITGVDYGKDPKDKEIHVRMSVSLDDARRIRTDSEASIEGKGLLGDKMIVITVGSQDKPALPEGANIPSKQSDDLTQMMSKLSQISGHVENVVNNLERTTSALADDKFQGDIHQSMAALAGILGSVDHGDGYVSKLLHDPGEAQRLSHLMANLEQTSGELEHTAANVNQILGRVQTGPGFAHEVVYGEDGAKTIAKFGNVADELTTTLKGVREGNGIARSVIYGDDSSQQVMGNLNQVSLDLKQMVADVHAGKGTLGALLVDPSVYEDLKLMLGNVERNRTLRALVRYSIKADEKSPSVEVRDPGPTKPPAEAATTGNSAGKGVAAGE